MSEPAQRFEANFDPSLSNAGVPHGLNDSPAFRNPIPSTSTGFTGAVGAGLPALPPRPDLGLQSYRYNPSAGFGMTGMSGGYGMGGYGGFGMGNYGYGMGGMGSLGSPYGGYNRFGPTYGADVESRFIQMAEENSRPAFDSIQSVVYAVGSVAMMLENTFFALTSSFRAILGVAENFGRLRSLFAQFWSTFAVVRSINWLVRKLMVIMGIRTESEFKAWAQAVEATQAGTATPEQKAKGSSWPILLFFGVIAAAPYIVLKMLNSLSCNINEKLNDPTSWQNPLRAIAQYDYAASSPEEISFSANQVLYLAPQHLQGNLWNSGWLMASTDKQKAGLIPVPYIRVVKPENEIGPNTQLKPVERIQNEKTEPNMEDLNKFYEKEL